jgi:hypothetical protein
MQFSPLLVFPHTLQPSAIAGPQPTALNVWQFAAAMFRNATQDALKCHKSRAHHPALLLLAHSGAVLLRDAYSASLGVRFDLQAASDCLTMVGC